LKSSLLVIATIISFLFISCTDRPNTVIEGNLSNSAKKYIRLEYLDINKTQLIDSVRIKSNGNFRFRFFAAQPGLYILKNENGKIINLLISGGNKIRISGDYSAFDRGYKLSGSAESEYIRMLVEKLSDTRERLKGLDSVYTGKDETAINEYRLRRYMIIKEQRDSSISFIIGHLSSMASIYALYQKLSPEELVLGENKDIQFMKIVADSVSRKYPESDFVRTFVRDARSAEQRYLNLIGLQKKIADSMNGLPDIKLPDQQGNIKSLLSLRGKTVLLYFWSVYSDVCKQQNPVFEKIYRKYKNRGFEIYAVCIDRSNENWLKMVRFDELSFINVTGPEIPDSETAHAYNLREIPSTYLLDKAGNILERELYGTDLEKWLDNKL
jgi:peroxiredoxin